ncbi:MAG: PRC-barrel domain-containing protein [Roseovarius sp.]
MKRFAIPAVATALAATTAFAQNATDSEMETDTQNTQMESSSAIDGSSDTASDGSAMTTEDAVADENMGEDKDMAASQGDMNQMQGELIRSRDITGGAIYTTNEAHDEGSGWEDAEYSEVGSEWNQIGEIEDLVLSKDGKMTGIVAEVGGFLDIGDKHVVISVDDAKLVPVDDAEYVFVTKYNEEELESMDGIDEGFWN